MKTKKKVIESATASQPDKNITRVLITGAGQGLGQALALHWAKKGTQLLLHAHTSLQTLEETAQQAQQQGAQVEVFQADLSQSQARENMLAEVSKCCQSLSLLINNAAVFDFVPPAEWEAEQFSLAFEINCSAVHHLILLCRTLLQRGAPSLVVNLGDAAADRVRACVNNPAYHISKLGVNVLTRSFAKELGPAGIRVNMVSPGILHNSWEIPTDPNPEIPLVRKGNFDDIIAAVDYLYSPQASYVSGANLVISGGWNI